MSTEGLSIGDVANRTGIGISTLRAWERRHGFPVAERLPSGHRRYSERDVEAINEIQRERRAGSTLEAALSRAQKGTRRQRSSLFATLREALPNTAPALLSKRAMTAISRSIEDEAAARAVHAVLLGSFQDARFWRASAARWRDLAAASQTTAILASFRQTRQRGPVFEIALAPGTPTLREWAVICDSPGLSACVVGVEQLGPRRHPDSKRRFEALWTVEPLAVRDVARTGFALAAERNPEVSTALGHWLQQPVQATYDTIRTATAITNRIVAYLDLANESAWNEEAVRPADRALGK